MENAKHTSGPWCIVGEFGADNVFISNGCQEDSDGRTIATVVYNQDQSQEANARLIASAPDLLEALELAFNSGFLPEGGEPYNAAKAAIAMAKVF